MNLETDVTAIGAALRAKTEQLQHALLAKVDDNLSGGRLQTRSGALRSSIRSAIDADADAISARVESVGVVYAAIQEYGGQTPAHDIVATKTKAVGFAAGGGVAFAKIIHHPGSSVPARAYLGSALDAMRADIRTGLKAALLEALGTET